MTPTTPPAGTDPAFFPGLVPPQSGTPGKTGSTNAVEDAVPSAPGGSAAARKPAAAKAPEPEPEAEPEPAVEPGKDADAPTAVDAPGDDAGTAAGEGTADTAAGEDDDQDADDGRPVFRAADRRAAIVADRRGVTFTLDEEIAEFGWDEIGAVEIDTPRFGKRFGVTVYTSARRWFQCDVEAASRSRLKQWTAELDAVLDARFEDEKPEAEDADGAPGLDDAADAADTEDVQDAGAPKADAKGEAEAVTAEATSRDAADA